MGVPIQFGGQKIQFLGRAARRRKRKGEEKGRKEEVKGRRGKEKGRKRKEKERRKENKKGEEERKKKKGKRKECCIVSRLGRQRTRNCAARGRFPPTRVIFRANLYVVWFVCDCVMVKDRFHRVLGLSETKPCVSRK